MEKRQRSRGISQTVKIGENVFNQYHGIFWLFLNRVNTRGFGAGSSSSSIVRHPLSEAMSREKFMEAHGGIRSCSGRPSEGRSVRTLGSVNKFAIFTMAFEHPYFFILDQHTAEIWETPVEFFDRCRLAQQVEMKTQKT
jgi:hypothetical protein